MLSILVSNAVLGLLIGLIPALDARLDKAPLKLMGVGLIFGAVLGVWAQRQWVAIAQAEARRKRRQPDPPRVGAGGTLIGEASVVRYDPTPPPAPKLPVGAMPPPPAPAGVFGPLEDDVAKPKKGILGISTSQLSPALANLVQVGEKSRKAPHIEANASLSVLVSMDDEMNADDFLGAFDSIFDESIFEVSDPTQGDDDDFFKPLAHASGEDPATDRGLPIVQPKDHPAFEQSGLLMTRFDEDILDPAQLFSDKSSKAEVEPVSAALPPEPVHRPENPTPLLQPVERKRLLASGDKDKTRVLFGQYQKALRKCGRNPENVTFAMFSQHVERERRRVEQQYDTKRIGMQVRVKGGKPRIIIRPLGVKR